MVGARIVVFKGENKNKTGTVISGAGYFEVLLDEYYFYVDGALIRSKHVYEIDDITNVGNIEFRKGDYIYDTTCSMVGLVLESYDFEDYSYQRVKYQDGPIVKTMLIEEDVFLVIDILAREIFLDKEFDIECYM